MGLGEGLAGGPVESEGASGEEEQDQDPQGDPDPEPHTAAHGGLL
jgi:hypothetical protein